MYYSQLTPRWASRPGCHRADVPHNGNMTAGRCLSALLPFAACLAATPDPVDLVRRSLAAENENARRARDYTFIQRTEDRDLDSQGNVKSMRSKTHDVTML